MLQLIPFSDYTTIKADFPTAFERFKEVIYQYLCSRRTVTLKDVNDALKKGLVEERELVDDLDSNDSGTEEASLSLYDLQYKKWNILDTDIPPNSNDCVELQHCHVAMLSNQLKDVYSMCRRIRHGSAHG